MARIVGNSELTPAGPRVRIPVRTILGYILMVVFTLVALMLISRLGAGLSAPMAGRIGSSTSQASVGDTFLRVLIALTAIIVLGQFLGRLFAAIGQPPVIGEVMAGILLGPSLLGPQISGLILPPSVAPFLGLIAQLGIVLYMFMVGLDLNPGLLRSRAHAAVAISHASILAPFLLGAALALFIYPVLSTNDVPFTSFALFMGLAMSITAFPVLARILTDYRLTQTRLGAIALSCAAVDDVTAWCLLAIVVGLANAQGGQGLLVVASAFAFIFIMLVLVKPAMVWVTRRWGGADQPGNALVIVFVALLVSALTAEAIGIHAIFGAFLLGAIIPHDSAPAKILTRQLGPIVTILLLPAFFAFTGMRTRIDLLSGPMDWLICGAIILVATIGKFGGSFAAARLSGLDWRNAARLGTLMNTRGLMELIVLNVGLELRVISPTLFSMMVVMALATTAITAPVLHLLRTRRGSDEMLEILRDPPSGSDLPVTGYITTPTTEIDAQEGAPRLEP